VKQVNFRGANWLEVKKDSEGIHLRSPAKNIGDIIVSHVHKGKIKDGWKK